MAGRRWQRPGHWCAAEIAIDGLHHAVYAAATSATFELLDAHAAAPR